MRAKEQMIKQLMIQREFIRERLRDTLNKSDGDPSLVYHGYVYPQNIRYFNDLGYCVEEVKSEYLKALAKGRPTYLFHPKEDLGLETDELDESKKYAEEFMETQARNCMSNSMSFFDMLQSIMSDREGSDGCACQNDDGECQKGCSCQEDDCQCENSYNRPNNDCEDQTL